ncbi:hypothetical protein Nepgr_007518 [Nepenthes gracilis]|uniref:B box-type domain-containing protein n=1 Tax=Nepenthes gracilis TaxID=150966 RepID=A0AAD3S759_NEPGR|nr:hypothetical protein Nepgr_007518 [Nepenthes gracilis]
MTKGCELCKAEAKMFCESDQASLCWDCDEKVHAANFLVAKHTRTVLCHVCQAETPWKAAGARLGRTTSVCDACVGKSNGRARKEEVKDEGDEVVAQSPTVNDDAVHGNERDEFDDQYDEDDVDEEEEEDEDNCSDYDGDDDDDENQVVPWSLTPPTAAAASATCSGEEESAFGIREDSSIAWKRLREIAIFRSNDDEDENAASSMTVRCAAPPPPPDDDEAASVGFIRSLKHRRVSFLLDDNSPR